MLRFEEKPVYLACGVIDMRKLANGLMTLVGIVLILTRSRKRCSCSVIKAVIKSKWQVKILKILIINFIFYGLK